MTSAWRSWIDAAMPHLVAVPILLPMFTGACMLLMNEEKRRAKLGLNLLSTLAGLLLAIALLRWVDGQGGPGGVASFGIYLPGNWQAPYGIALAIDRLSALMLVLANLVALCAVVFSVTRWHRAGVHFHPLFQFQLMGLAGAFLTADLFNLFVFFEIMLAASYGLLLHGSGRARVQAGLHYIAINLAASSLFLIGTSMLYGVTGTLNMADLARVIPQVAAADRGLLHAGAAVLAVAFLAKAAAWPLNFWLVPAYAAATAPVGALFAILSKVGVYTVLRLWTLLFSADAGASAFFGEGWLVGAGFCTLAFGAIGILASQRLGNLAGYGVIISSGTLLAAIGFRQEMLTAGALYYLLSSTLAASAFFLLVDLVERWRNHGAAVAPHERADLAPFLTPDLKPVERLNLDEEEAVLVGRAIPAAIACLGLAFICCTLLIAGLPPLSGFIGKFAMLSALIDPAGLGADGAAPPTPLHWTFMALLILSGLLALVALSRAGIRHFWSAAGRGVPRLQLAEGLPIAVLVGATMLLAVQGGKAMRYLEDTAAGLHRPGGYIDAVLSTRPRPNPAAGPTVGPAPQPERLP
ncbi:MAG: monovalent cation/H+ antiporter subunit D [Xylophilus ampelinus]